jgi:hypothetical protein
MSRTYDISLRLPIHFESEEEDFRAALLQHVLANLSVNQYAEVRDLHTNELLQVPIRIFPAQAVRSMTPQCGEIPSGLSSPGAPR